MVEDLINGPPFTSFPAWLAEQGERWDGTPGVRCVACIGEVQQIGAISHRAALPPLVGFNLEPEDHFQRALHRAQQPLPFEGTPVVDADLRFVASLHIEGLRTLRDWRGSLA